MHTRKLKWFEQVLRLVFAVFFFLIAAYLLYTRAMRLWRSLSPQPLSRRFAPRVLQPQSYLFKFACCCTTLSIRCHALMFYALSYLCVLLRWLERPSASQKRARKYVVLDPTRAARTAPELMRKQF